MTVADQINDLFEAGSMRAQIAYVIFQGEPFTMPGLGDKFGTHATNVRSVITRMNAAGYRFSLDSDGGHKSPVVYTLLSTTPSDEPDPLPQRPQPKALVGAASRAAKKRREAKAREPKPEPPTMINERSTIENLIDLLELQYRHGMPVRRIEPAAEWIRLTRELFAE